MVSQLDNWIQGLSMGYAKDDGDLAMPREISAVAASLRSLHFAKAFFNSFLKTINIEFTYEKNLVSNFLLYACIVRELAF